MVDTIVTSTPAATPAAVRTYRYKGKYIHRYADGRLSIYRNSSTRRYVLKRHYPDADEIAAARAEIEAGALRKTVAARLGVSTFRLRRLLAAEPAPSIRPLKNTVSAPTPAPYTLSDEDLETLLVGLGVSEKSL